MKKTLTLLVAALFTTACNTKPEVAKKEIKPMAQNKKVLVAYFSATGTTKRVAENLAKATGAVVYEIKPAVPYTDADLNWRDSNSRSSVEMNNKTSRPEMAADNFSVKEYDTVYLGFPIWWGTAPHIVETFLEKHDFIGKTIILFATSGSSGMGNTDKDLKSSVSASTKIVKGKTLNSNPSVEELKKWVATFL
ncbi:MAG: flavodoxin [Elusimicrobiaceae bacterium]|nr:flavodoxin [Elusimicrobiaceae bacterium]